MRLLGVCARVCADTGVLLARRFGVFPRAGYSTRDKTSGRNPIFAGRPIADPLRMRFTEQIWSYALPLKTVHDKAFADGVGEDRLGYSWQQLPEAVRQAVVSELAPYFAEHPSLTFLPFNRCSDLRDINIADEDYRCAELDIETGIERLRVEISWADFTDKQILRAFKIWLKENRPRDFGRADSAFQQFHAPLSRRDCRLQSFYRSYGCNSRYQRYG